jgi:hypothetical protein
LSKFTVFSSATSPVPGSSAPGAAFSSEGKESTGEKSCDPETTDEPFSFPALALFPLSSLALRVRLKMFP